jgi:hypothetical protein
MKDPASECLPTAKNATYRAEQGLGTGETTKRREFIALIGASVAWPFQRRQSNRGGPIASAAWPSAHAMRRGLSRCSMNCGGARAIGKVMRPCEAASLRPRGVHHQKNLTALRRHLHPKTR